MNAGLDGRRANRYAAPMFPSGYSSPVPFLLAATLLACVLPGRVRAGDGHGPDALTKAVLLEPEVVDRIDSWAFDFEAGILWRITGSTDLDYVIAPSVFSLRTPAHLVFEAGDSLLVVRSRFNLLAEAVLEGPEHHYFGLSGSPSIEWWFPERETYLHFAVGGGAGFIDSQGVEGGQGQDFTFNWFIHTGIRHFLSERTALSFGVFYQHLSNRGATDPNPGIDALGPMIGLTHHF